jgi:hypothetical protein
MGRFEIEVLKFQHEEIQEALSCIVREGGRIGDAAKAVAKVVEAHFTKEEELVFPLLDLLQPLAQENLDISIEDTLNLIDKMEANIVVLHDENRRVVIALKPLIEAAKDENRLDYLRFSDRLLLYARAEKEFIYPTAILIGKYLKIKKNILEISRCNTTKIIRKKEKISMEFIPEIDTRVYTLLRDRENVSMLG